MIKKLVKRGVNLKKGGFPSNIHPFDIAFLIESCENSGIELDEIHRQCLISNEIHRQRLTSNLTWCEPYDWDRIKQRLWMLLCQYTCLLYTSDAADE